MATNPKSIKALIDKGGYDNLSEKTKAAIDKHPGAVNLVQQQWDKEASEKARLKGLETRRRNKAIREEQREIVEGFAQFMKNDAAVEKVKDVNALLYMKYMMAVKDAEGDHDSAIDIAKNIAEYEQPKLARVDQTNREVSYDNLPKELLDKFANNEISEEEFEAEAAKYQ